MKLARQICRSLRRHPDKWNILEGRIVYTDGVDVDTFCMRSRSDGLPDVWLERGCHTDIWGRWYLRASRRARINKFWSWRIDRAVRHAMFDKATRVLPTATPEPEAKPLATEF